MDKPCERNFCGGAYQDWLEVMLTPDCNGKCPWCVERDGWHPDKRAPWQEIARQAIRSCRTHIILLGGEPTLYPDLGRLVGELRENRLRVYITTNGSRLSPAFVYSHLQGITGVNVSIHNSVLYRNRFVTGIQLKEVVLRASINTLHDLGATVRFNCNLIEGHIDTAGKMVNYVEWAKNLGVDSVRFAELKGEGGGFVDAAKAWGHDFGLNDDPFRLGCNTEATVWGMPVTFRQMCGLQTPHRPRPERPLQFPKLVLYYDGLFYQGWQTKEDHAVDKDALRWLLEDVKAGRLPIEEAQRRIAEATAESATRRKGSEDPIEHHQPVTDSGGCCY